MNKWLPRWLASWLNPAAAVSPASAAIAPQQAAEDSTLAAGDQPAPSSGAAAATWVPQLADVTSSLSDAVRLHEQSIESMHAELAAVRQGDAAAVAVLVCRLLALNQELQHRLVQGERKLQEHAQRLAKGCGTAEIPAAALHGTPPAGQHSGQGGEESADDGRRRAHLELAAETFADPTFLPALARRIAEWRRGGATCSLILARLDGMDEVAAQHGHDARQTALTALCRLASAALREMDQPVRWGDDGLAILLPGARAADAASVGRRLLEAVRQSQLPVGERVLALSLSAGVAELAEGNDAPRLLARAWQALDAARQAGGGQVQVG
jgi:diguanylate cyclase (GGDEF)-like protein